MLDQVQRGATWAIHRGVPFFKSLFDIGLYLQRLSRLAPRTVIEIDAKFGSALWFADMLAAQGVEGARVLSMDIEPQARLEDRRIAFLGRRGASWRGAAADAAAGLSAPVPGGGGQQPPLCAQPLCSKSSTPG